MAKSLPLGRSRCSGRPGHAGTPLAAVGDPAVCRECVTNDHVLHSNPVSVQVQWRLQAASMHHRSRVHMSGIQSPFSASRCHGLGGGKASSKHALMQPRRQSQATTWIPCIPGASRRLRVAGPTPAAAGGGATEEYIFFFQRCSHFPDKGQTPFFSPHIDISKIRLCRETRSFV